MLEEKYDPLHDLQPFNCRDVDGGVVGPSSAVSKSKGWLQEVDITGEGSAPGCSQIHDFEMSRPHFNDLLQPLPW